VSGQTQPEQQPLAGFKWPVSVTQAIENSAEDVWRVISTPGHLEFCHPFCAGNPVHVWPGATAHDEVHYLNGWVFERRFLRWVEGRGYDLEIGRRGGRVSFVSWRLEITGPHSCDLRITVYPHVLQSLPVILRWLPHRLRVRPLLQDYLLSVTRGVEWYMTHQEPVPRNHFGRHPWFSGTATAELMDEASSTTK